MTPTSVFTLGRMRHLDLLALWLQLHPDNQEVRSAPMGAVSKERLVDVICEGP